MEKYGDRVRKRRNELGLSQEDLAKLAGFSHASAIGNIERREGASTKTVVLAAALKVHPRWLEDGTEPKELSYVELATANEATADLIAIPLLTFPGTASTAKRDPAPEYLKVAPSRLGVSFTTLTNLALTTATGDTMEGTFNAGDLLLVDRGVNEVKQDAVYVLTLDGELYIKRLQRLPEGKLLMISDNRKYEPVVIENDAQRSCAVLARVLMVWNARKL